MKKSHPKPIIGIVGAVGAGKSTVSNIFRQLGCAVISADALNHACLKREDVKSQLVEKFGVKIITPAGQVNRSALAGIVFDDPARLKELTDLVHPIIEQYEDDLIETFQSDPEFRAIVLDVPLLLEAHQEDKCDVIVMIETDKCLRYQRLQEERGWNEEKIKKVENLQFALDIKRKISEYSIYNNSGIPDTASQVEQILNKVVRNHSYCVE